MTRAEVEKLHPGDEVFWEDPDGGECSRHITIRTIEVRGEVVRLTTTDGDSLECYPEELS